MALSKHTDFDQILLEVGQWSRYQWLMYVLLNAMVIPVGMHHLAHVFLAAPTDFWCSGTVNDTCDQINGTNASCTSWEYDRSTFESTIITEFDLVCDWKWLEGTAQSIYMAGVMVGVIVFGDLGDRLGRKLILMVTSLFLVLSGVIASQMPTYWSFVLFRLLVGACAGGNMTTVFVLGMEIIGGPARTYCGIFVQGWFAGGTMLMAVLAYFLTNFRHLQLCISLLHVLFLVYYWIVPESTRWQLTHGRLAEAEVTIRRIAEVNKRPLPSALSSSEEEKCTPAPTTEDSYSIFDLYKTPNLRKKTINIQFNWFVISMVYYGLSLLSTELPGNAYINTFISGLVELAACCVFAPLTQWRGRRWPVGLCTAIGGLVCLVAAFIPGHLGVVRTSLAMIGKFLISGSFAIIYVFSAELFPTVVRNVGVGSSSMFARVGGLTAPLIKLLGTVWAPLPFCTFGVLALLAGIFSLFLPETLNRKMPETIHEGENFGKRNAAGAI